jgi:hypothetical protein
VATRDSSAKIQRRGLALIALFLCGMAQADTPPSIPGSGPNAVFTNYVDAASSSGGGGGRAAPSPQLAVVLVNGKERDTGIAIVIDPTGKTLVALDYLVAALGLPTRVSEDAYVVTTPLGDARIALSMVTEIQGYSYVDTDTLSKAFASEIRFDSGEFALRVDTSWQNPEADASAKGAKAPPQAPADVLAPKLSLSQWHAEVDYLRYGQGDAFTSTTDLGGALGDGYWRMRYYDDLENRRYVDSWSWVTGTGNSRFLVGRQIVSLATLLPSIYLTGAQAAYTNRPNLMFGQAATNGEIIAARFNAPRTVNGKGPPGGTAELRRDGQVIARQPIRLDGTFEFREQNLNGGHVQIAVFDRSNPQVPVRIEEIYEQASDQALPAGAYVHYAGIGTTANPLDPGLRNGHTAGFYQWRQGLTNSITGIAAVIDDGTERRSTAGVVWTSPWLGAWALSEASGTKGNASQLLGNGARGEFFWRADLRRDEAGFSSALSPRREDYNAEAGIAYATNLQTSLVARHFSSPGQPSVDFIRPAVAWQASRELSLSARPDLDGRYAFYATYLPAPGWRLGLTRYRTRTDLDVDKQLDGQHSLRGEFSDDSQLGRRAGMFAQGSTMGALPIVWTAGLLRGEHHTGYLLDGGMEVYPGVSVHAQAVDDPLLDSDSLMLGNAQPGSAVSSRLIELSVVVDFAVTPSGLARGGYRMGLNNSGGISGAIRAADGPIDMARLRGVGVILDGLLRGEVDANGRFLISDLTSGVYALELDSEKLPLEYQPIDRVRRVQVKSGAVTQLDFAIALRLGFAGRITLDGNPAKTPVDVLVRDETGNNVAKTKADAWGYYRVDGITPGRYTVSARAESEHRGAEIHIELKDRFLFGQNLALELKP